MRYSNILVMALMVAPRLLQAKENPCPEPKVQLFDLCVSVAPWVKDSLKSCRSGDLVACQKLGLGDNKERLFDIEKKPLNMCFKKKKYAECSWIEESAQAEPRNIIFQIALFEFYFAKCQAGDMAACNSLPSGWLKDGDGGYDDNWMVDSVDPRVIQLRKKLCNQGIVEQCEELVDFSRFIPEDPTKQRQDDEILRKACSLGSSRSCQERILRHFYSENETGVFLKKKGLALAKINCQQGSKEACYALGVYWVEMKQFDKTLKVFRRACDLANQEDKEARDKAEKAAADCRTHSGSILCPYPLKLGIPQTRDCPYCKTMNPMPENQVSSLEDFSSSSSPVGSMNAYCLVYEELSCFRGKAEACQKLVANRKPTCVEEPQYLHNPSNNPMQTINRRCRDFSAINEKRKKALSESIEKCLPLVQFYNLKLIVGHGDIVGIHSLQWKSGETNSGSNEEEIRGCILGHLESPRNYSYLVPSEYEVWVVRSFSKTRF